MKLSKFKSILDYICLFTNKQDAINARIEAEKKYFQDFAYANP